MLNYREPTLYRGLVICHRLNMRGQEKEELLGTDPRNQFPSTIHLWEMVTLATRSGLSLREILFHILHIQLEIKMPKKSQLSINFIHYNFTINVFLQILSLHLIRLQEVRRHKEYFNECHSVSLVFSAIMSGRVCKFSCKSESSNSSLVNLIDIRFLLLSRLD